MRKTRISSLFLALSIVSSMAAFALPAVTAVDLKNDGAMAVSVPLGTDNGVSLDNDFHVFADNASVTIYPQELAKNRFWSQPLSEEEYARIRTGMEARPAALDVVTHAVIRAKGEVRRSALLARQEEARRQFVRRKTEDLGKERESLMERRDAIDEQIAAAESDLSNEEDRMEWVMNAEDDRIDGSLQAIQDLADKRDALQAQREALALSSSRNDFARESAEIKGLSNLIESEQDAIRSARDRKGSARSAYITRKKEWQKLVAERRALRDAIRSIDLKIKELDGHM
jgi:chromosome segregation ATPase